MSHPYESLNWDSSGFSYPGMVRIRTIADGSCFFHAIANAYCEPYRTGVLTGGIPIDKKQFVKCLRYDLSLKLAEKINPLDPSSPIHYDTLSRGELRNFAKMVPEYTLENMRKELDSSAPVNNVYNEFISNQLNKDIYLLDAVKKDVYLVGRDDDILYKGRDSIVLLYTPGHYDLVGVLQGNGIPATLFKSDNPFIKALQSRIRDLRSRGSKGT